MQRLPWGAAIVDGAILYLFLGKWPRISRASPALPDPLPNTMLSE